MKLKISLITAVFILAAILFVWQSKNEPAITVPAGAKAGDFQTEPCVIEAKSIEYEADCGVLIVPENRADPETRLLALPITRVHATGKNPAEPIFYLTGGPGQSNESGRMPAALLANHDFVRVGYRGVDGSESLDCPEMAHALKGDGVDLLNEQSIAGLRAAARQCSERLQENGVDLDGYTIQEVIGDMETARIAMGYDRINLFSVSYGTRVAQLYVNQHPTSIHRSAMVGVTPPGTLIFWEPQLIDAQIEHYSRLYAQTDNPLSPDLAESMRTVSHDMPERWLFFKIDPGKVKTATFGLLYERGTAVQAFDAWLAAENGDPSGLALMSLAYDYLVPNSSVLGDMVSKAFSADYDANRDYLVELEPANSIIGSPLSYLFWASVSDADGVTWPTNLMPQEYRQVLPTEVETLLLSGNIDFVTPVEFTTNDLLPVLANGQQVILSEMGHVGDVMYLQPEAADHLLSSFFLEGEADDSLFTYDPVNFEVGLGFPEQAKIALGGVVVLILLIIGTVWFLVHRVRRRRGAVQ